MIDEIKIYAVFDTRKQKYWETSKQKNRWYSSTDAKNAWTNEKPTDDYPELIYTHEKYGWRTSKPFNEQDIFEIHEFTFTKASMRVIK